MTILRSAIFLAAALIWTSVIAVLCLPVLIMPRRLAQATTRFWLHGLLQLGAWICGLKYRVVGRANLPSGAAIIAAKHQSAWDTFVFHQILDDPVFVMKRELFGIPLVGWYMRKVGSVGIDRSARIQALKTLAADAKNVLSEGRQVIVFPEGTRVAPGDHKPYKPGVAVLYERCSAPVVPVALNSGVFWGRRSFAKHPGMITLEILPPIEPGMKRHDFLETLKSRIEEASTRLRDEARSQRRQAPSALEPVVENNATTTRETRG
ncbi:MAG: 1-acyl-sn-glycerol-3-phosphate acyltransferase [Rhodospirillales bacterium]|nr:1-acyl-sn-glycerol-3-phosphate acyltransferase [Rhodospirillales bacterium]